MQFSEQWLREWVNPALKSEELGHQLTMAGLEVDALAPVAPPFTGIVVGEVVEVLPHPDAEKLRLTTVNVGSGSLLQIVCGAKNVAAGLRVPVATLGAELPGGLKIKQAKLRGVESFGMLCAEAELGLAESSDGLMILPADAPIGTDIRAYLGLDDNTIELGITPNRGDCLSILGVAREAAVLNRLNLEPPAMGAVAAVIADTLPVSLVAPKACPHYQGRVIRGVNARAITPLWLAEKLRRAGLRPISPVVDVTNYVLLELGQPMHAFDLGKLNGGIQVRMATAGEALALLNGQTVTLRSDTLVIADADKALALAGIMGGEGSAVGDDTRDIFLESAFFDPLALAGKARSYGLHTDSSHRFERGVDFALQGRALERATRLILDICGGEPGPVVRAVSEADLPQRPAIRLRASRIQRLLGFSLAAAEVEDILTRLGMDVTAADDSWLVTPPSYRFDISIEADLIEELARIYGYNQLPITAPKADIRLQARAETAHDLGRIKQLFVDQGWQEAITMSFVEPGLLKRLDPVNEPLALANPISADLSVMRTTLWAGLIKAALYNQNRQQPRVRLFETGLRFIPHENGLKQQQMLAGIGTGDVLPELWSHSKNELDFFDIKGNLESLVALVGASDRVQYKAAVHPALHPGQSAEVLVDGRSAGWLGKLHPSLQQELGLLGPVYLFELELEALGEGVLPRFHELSRFPEVRRDLALVVAEQVPADAVMAGVREAAGGELRQSQLFDVYQGAGVEAGKRSLALSMVWQHPDRTLQDDEVQARVDAVLTLLKTRFGVSLRD
jgi:phenylalanyl-tRNA synthetase beta chain